jgi:hypothetical protein
VTVEWNGPNPLTVSNSEIQTFKSCPRKWWLVYYLELGLKRILEAGTGPRELGSRIHGALHKHYIEGANPITAIDEEYAADIAYFKDVVGFNDIQIIEIQKEQALAHAMLEGYLVWASETGIDAEMELIGAETVIQVASSYSGVFIRGKLDQRWRRKIDNAILFRDFKTVPEFTTPMKILPMDEQMLFYHLLEWLDSQQQTGSAPPHPTDGGLYTMLRKVKRTTNARPPFYMQVEIPHNTAQLRAIWSRVHSILGRIVETRKALDAAGENADHNFIVPPRPSRDCTWACDFFQVCSLFDDGSNAKGLLNERYTHVDPHERYKAQDEGRSVTE